MDVHEIITIDNDILGGQSVFLRKRERRIKETKIINSGSRIIIPYNVIQMKLESRLKYLHENPVRAGLVRYEQDYIYSSGIDYYSEEKGLIEVDFV